MVAQAPTSYPYSMPGAQQTVLWALRLLLFIGLCTLVVALTQPAFRAVAADEYTRFGRDFANFWSGGAMLWGGEVDTVYDRAAYQSRMEGWRGMPLDPHSYSYPPHSLLLTALIGWMPFWAAWLAWTAGGVSAFSASLRAHLTTGERNWLLFAPAVFVCVLCGQTGLWIAALWFGGLFAMRDRPLLAGVLFGLLTVKPQFGPLLVLALLLSGNWRTIASATATTLALVAISVALMGIDPWIAFVTDTLPYQRAVIDYDFGAFDYMVPSWYKWVLNQGGSHGLAWSVQGVSIAASVIGTALLYRSRADRAVKIGGLSVLVFLFSPYMAVYDMVLLVYPALLLWRANRTAALVVLSLPVTGVVLAVFGWPVSQLAITGLAAWFVLRAVRTPA